VVFPSFFTGGSSSEVDSGSLESPFKLSSPMLFWICRFFLCLGFLFGLGLVWLVSSLLDAVVSVAEG